MSVVVGATNSFTQRSVPHPSDVLDDQGCNRHGETWDSDGSGVQDQKGFVSDVSQKSRNVLWSSAIPVTVSRQSFSV